MTREEGTKSNISWMQSVCQVLCWGTFPSQSSKQPWEARVYIFFRWEKAKVQKVYVTPHLLKARTEVHFLACLFSQLWLQLHWGDWLAWGSRGGFPKGSSVCTELWHLSRRTPGDWGEQGHFRQRKGNVKEYGVHRELKIAVQGKSTACVWWGS